MVALKVGSLFVTVDRHPGDTTAVWRVYEDNGGAFGRLLAGGQSTRDVPGDADLQYCLVDAMQNAVAEARRRQADDGLPMMAWEGDVFGWSSSVR